MEEVFAPITRSWTRPALWWEVRTTWIRASICWPRQSNSEKIPIRQTLVDSLTALAALACKLCHPTMVGSLHSDNQCQAKVVAHRRLWAALDILLMESLITCYSLHKCQTRQEWATRLQVYTGNTQTIATKIHTIWGIPSISSPANIMCLPVMVSLSTQRRDTRRLFRSSIFKWQTKGFHCKTKETITLRIRGTLEVTNNLRFSSTHTQPSMLPIAQAIRTQKSKVLMSGLSQSITVAPRSNNQATVVKTT